ncbi:hypothetical protein ACP4OV_011578 [Aristida adscensionis]
MDRLCDTLMVEEILPRVLPKYLIRLRAASRRYNALALRPDFAARYWRRAGVLFQPFHPGRSEIRPHFLTAPGAQEPVSGTDLSFLPGPSAREKDYLLAVGARDGATSGIAVVHSTAGLLLCSRGCIHPVHFYVCNPVTRQWVALPEQPWPSAEWQCGLLTVSTDNGDGAAGRFKVVLFNLPMHWEKEGGCLDLRLFSSDTGRWEAAQLPPPILNNFATRGPICGQSGTAYRTSYRVKDRALAYNGANGACRFIPLPPSPTVNPHPPMRIIGERQGGGLCFASCDGSSLDVWNTRNNQSENGTLMLLHRISIAELLHRISIAELLERNPESGAFLIQPTMVTMSV